MAMKRPIIHVENTKTEIEGLVFFAQALEELLFDHTIDSFKAPALNSISRAFELRRLAKQGAEKSQKYTKFILPVIRELEWSIKNDPVITGNDAVVAHDLLAKIASPEKSLDEITILADSLILHLSEYWKNLRKIIKSSVQDGRQKKKLKALAAIFTAQIELEGFSRRYAYYITNSHLLKKIREPIDKENVLDVIDKFLDMFSQKSVEWEIIYRGSKSFEMLESYCSSYRMEVTATAKDSDVKKAKVIANFLNENTEFPLYIYIKVSRARDCYRAREIADSILGTFTAACKFHVHDLNLKVSKQCVIKSKDSSYILINPAVDPMMSGAVSIKTDNLNELIKETTELLAGHHLSPNSTRMYNNALEYHKAALEAGTPENQILDLWAAIEGFLPQPSDTGNRVGHYTALLVPSLTLSYPTKIFKYMSDSLLFAGKEVEDFINSQNIEGDFFSKTTCLIVAEELMDERIKLLSLKSMHPLMRFTINQIYDSFNSKKLVLNTLLNHREKVSWHIQRIYTTRNLIIHSADSLPYLRTLVENLHSYLDILIPSITKLAIYSRVSLEIDAAVRLLSIHEDYLLSELRKKEEKCTIENYKNIVFGSDNPLSPFNDNKLSK